MPTRGNFTIGLSLGVAAKDKGTIASWRNIKRATMKFNQQTKEKAAELDELDKEIERLEREEGEKMI